MPTTPNLSFAGLFLLLCAAMLVLWAVNHRRGALLIATGCFAVFGGVMLLYLMRGVASHSTAQYVAIEEASAPQHPLPPVQPPRRALPAAEISTTIPVEVSHAAEPAQQPTTPAPAWVKQSSRKVDGADQFTVTAGPQATDDLCKKDMTQELRRKVDDYIDGFLGEAGAARRVNLSMAYIHNKLVTEQYFETKPASFGPMQYMHVLVKVDRPTRDMIHRLYEESLVQARTGYAVGSFGLLLVLLGTTFGYLKLDTLTKGYYSGRLKLAATAVILTAAAATALVVRQVDPATSWALSSPSQGSTQFVEY